MVVLPSKGRLIHTKVLGTEPHGRRGQPREKWTPNCVAVAKLNVGRRQYSTFLFLAGTLQDGCLESLDALRGLDVMIDFVSGGDT